MAFSKCYNIDPKDKQLIKVMFLDLDGTSLHSNATFSEQTIALLKEWQINNRLILTTGRPSYLLKYYIKQLGVAEPAITVNGSIIYDTANDKTICKTTLSENDYRDFLILAWSRHMDFAIFTENAIYLVEYSKRYMHYAEYNQYALTNRTNPVQFFRCHQLHDFFDIPINEIVRASVMFHDDGEPAVISDFVNTHNNVSASKSSAEIIDLCEQHVDKWNAIKYVCSHYGISLESICTVGNDQNDVKMLTHAPCSFAVANATPDAKAAAKYIIDSNNDDGVYLLLKTLMS